MDFEDKIREAYNNQKHSECLVLIESAPLSLKNSSRYKILKASCLNNLPGKSKEAHACVDEVISVEPENALAYYGKGLVYINEGKFKESIDMFDKAIHLDPSEKMKKARRMKVKAERMLVTLATVKTEVKTEIQPEKQSEITTPKIKKKRTRVVSEDGEKPLVSCPICFKTFQKPYSLVRHNLLHTGNLDFALTRSRKLKFQFIFR